MSKKEVIEIDGKVVECLSNGVFLVELENGHRMSARLSGKMRQQSIRVILGDAVRVELSPYDLTKGRITFRYIKGRDNYPQMGANKEQDGEKHDKEKS